MASIGLLHIPVLNTSTITSLERTATSRPPQCNGLHASGHTSWPSAHRFSGLEAFGPQECKLRNGGCERRNKQRQCRVVKVRAKVDTDAGGSSASGSVLSFLCPLLKLFSGGDAAAPRSRALEVATTGVASMARLPWGSKVREDIVASRDPQKLPQQPLQLYEFEACPFCRRVREALTELDLSAQVFPCPKDSIRHRAMVQEKGGRQQFPFLVDPNKGVTLYESGDIVKYLFQEYGNGAKPSPWLLESTPLTGWVPTLVRAGRGMARYEKAAGEAPSKAIELFSYENNQFARLVREALCELELPYVLKNVGKGSPNRDELLRIAGSTQVPYLVDSNTGVALAKSDAIVRYLFDTYSIQTA